MVPPSILKSLEEVTGSSSARSHTLGRTTSLLVTTPLQPELGEEIQQHHHPLVMPESGLPVILGTVTQVMGYVLGLSYFFTSGAKQLGICFTFFKWSTLWFILQGAQANV